MAASVVIFSRVAPGREEAYLAWEQEIKAVEATFDGFAGHRVEPPAPDGAAEWTVIVSFDTEEHLGAWLDSPQRRAMLGRAAEFNEDLRVERTSYGFGFWDRQDAGAGPKPERVFKENLLVLLVLYPTVYLWGYAAGTPLLQNALGWPFWAVLFVGNVASTQLLGWWFVPWAMKAFRRWLAPRPSWVTQLVGYGAVALLCVGFMALYAWLIALVGY